MNALEEAILWMAKDISAIGCYPGSKAVWKGVTKKFFVENLTSTDKIVEWFDHKRNNLAIVPRETSNGHLVALDFDSDEAFFDWFDIAIHQTRIDKTRDGFHVYFWTKDDPSGLQSDLCEIKYNEWIVVPPSVVDGFKYTLWMDKPIATIERLQDVIECDYAPSKERELSHPQQVVINIENLNISIADDPLCGNFPQSETKNVTPKIVSGKTNIERIKEAVKITDLFPEYKLSGDGYAMARCPTSAHPNGDRNPSLSLDLRSNRARCLKPGCPLNGNRGNDVLDVYKILNGLSTKQAIARMFDEMGI